MEIPLVKGSRYYIRIVSYGMENLVARMMESYREQGWSFYRRITSSIGIVLVFYKQDVSSWNLGYNDLSWEETVEQWQAMMDLGIIPEPIKEREQPENNRYTRIVNHFGIYADEPHDSGLEDEAELERMFQALYGL